VRQGQGGAFEVVYLVTLGPRTMIRNFTMQYGAYPDGGPGLVESATELGLQPERAATAQRVIDFTQKAIQHLHNHGYPDAALDRRRVIVDLSASRADVTLFIATGERYLFGPLLVENEGGRTYPDYVRQLAEIVPGTVYSRAQVDATADALRATGLFSGIDISPAQAEGGALPQRIELTEREAARRQMVDQRGRGRDRELGAPQSPGPGGKADARALDCRDRTGGDGRFPQAGFSPARPEPARRHRDRA
jgi:translocation and assembly module TamA